MALPTLNGLLCCFEKLKESLQGLLNLNTGNATLVAGTVAVADTAVKAGSYVLLTRKTISGTAGNLTYVLTAGTGITINSSSGTDAGVITFQIIH